MVYPLILVVTLTVMHLPGIGCIIAVPPNDTLVIYGDSTQLNCSYVGERMVAAWYKGEPPNHVRLTLGRTSQNPELYEVVGDEDMFEYNLRIRNATKESSDLYECTDLDLPGNSETAYVFVIDGVPNCTVHPGKTAIQGESVSFECSIDLNENAPGDLVWLQNGEEVSRDQGQHYTWETQLSSSDHTTTFDCQLQHYTLPKWKWSTISCQENIRMNVQYAPDVSVVYASQNPMREEADFIAVCEAIDANPEEKTDEYWIGPDGKMISVSTSLLLLNVSRETSGEYTCFMSNVFYNGVKGNGTATVEIDVQYLSSIDMAVTPFVNITEGDEVTIHCEALDGNPDPHRLEMLFEGNVINQRDGRVLNHTIASIEASYSGIYQCNAYTLFYDDAEEHSSVTKDIVVYYSPKLVSDDLEFEADIGDDVSISCEVHGFPTPAIKWFDKNSDIIIGEEENLNIIVRLIDSEALVKSTLTVTVADESYYGRYTCKATNNIPPDDEQTMEIVKPGSNSGIIAISITCTVIVVVLVVGIVLGILLYKKRVAKNQSNNTDYANAGPDTSDYAEIPAINKSHRQEPEGLSEANDLDPLPESTVEKFHPNSPKNVGGENITSSQMTKAAPQKDIGNYEVNLSSIGSPGQKSKSQPADTEQMQYASLQLTQPSEYQSLR